jgi:uncharacterized protein (DUF433 family)
VDNYPNILEYLQLVANDNPFVELHEEHLTGRPLIRGTRVQVSLVLRCLADGMTIDEVCEEYNLRQEYVRGAVDYAADLIDKPFQHRQSEAHVHTEEAIAQFESLLEASQNGQTVSTDDLFHAAQRVLERTGHAPKWSGSRE